MRRRNFVQIVLFTLLACLFSASTGPAQEVKWVLNGEEVYLVRKADNFIILYDSSGSMEDRYPGTHMTQLQAVRKILLEKNATLPDMNWQAGFYSFTPAGKLENLIPYYPMQAYNKKKFSWTMLKDVPLEPTGPTMLQMGLYELGRILPTLSGRTVVFLFNDGQYTPVERMPSPVQQAGSLAARHDICFVVINTSTVKDDFRTLKAIASVNDCSYMVSIGDLLGNPEWMTNALFEVVDKPSGDAITGKVWDNVLFDFNSSHVKREYYGSLAALGSYLRATPEAKVILEGHTDSVGTREYNLKLSHRRAASVRTYLVEKEGIDANRITLSGFGFDRPAADNATTEGRARNRRVQAIVTGVN